MDKTAFINIVKDGAIKGMIEYGVLASPTIAQAMLESACGASAPGNMLFGIKWTEGCGYDKQLLWTSEYYNGVRTRVQAYFRKYNSMADSIADHAYFLKKNKRYANLLGLTDYKTVCRLLQQDGYATDPNYATSLINLIEAYKLYQYDKLNGWYIVGGEWYYYNGAGVKVKNDWAKDSHGWYWLDADGKITKNNWVQHKSAVDGKLYWYYLGEDGMMYENKWCKWKAQDGEIHQYYLGEGGKMLANCTTPDGYYVNEKGEWDGKEKI